MSKSVKCGWCGLVDPSPHSEVIHRGTLECVDTQACANRLAEAEKTALERERDAARAEVERLREEMASVVSVAQGYEETNRRLRVEVERLREAVGALLDAEPLLGELCKGDCQPGINKHVEDCAVGMGLAALAGAPSETRREQDRALAERVREAIAALIEDADDGVPLQCLADAVRALDLDALLGER